MKRSLVTTAILAFVVLAVEARAQNLQPGMRTMIQRGGPEGLPLTPALPDDLDDSKLQPGMRTMIQRGGTEGVLLGSLFPFAGADDAYDAPAYDPYDPAPAYGARRHRARDVLHVRN
ncbi:MAG: hypothetical protein PGN25_16770 [Methylorubrum populi]